MLNGNKLILILTCCLLLTGCWGTTEIEQRGFVVGTAIDLEGKQANDKHDFLMTNQIINPAATTTAKSGGGGGQKGFVNISASGKSLFANSRKIRHQTNLLPYYQHLKVILISEDVLKEPGLLPDVMDVFVRNHELRRGVKVFATKDDAKKILDYVPEIEKTPAMFLDWLTENSKNSEIIEPKRVDRLQNIFIYDRSYFIPRVKLENNEIVYEDAVVVQGSSNQMVGILNKEETKGLMYIIDHTKGGSIETELDGDKITVETASTKTKVKLTNKDKGSLAFSVKITFEGSVEESFVAMNLLKKENIKKLEAAIEKDLKKLVERTIQKSQKEYKVDVLHFGEVIREDHYELWKSLVDNWDRGENYFSTSEVDVTVEAKIMSVGASNRVKENRKRDE